MSIDPSKLPDGYHSVNISLVMKGAAEAIEFYKKAFNAVEIYRLKGSDDEIMHAEISIGDTTIMLSDEYPSWGALSPKSIGGCPITLMVYVPDADAAFAQAIDAGATEIMAVADQFWGDRMGGVSDPFGYKWNVAHRKEEVSPEELEKRVAAWKNDNGVCGN